MTRHMYTRVLFILLRTYNVGVMLIHTESREKKFLVQGRNFFCRKFFSHQTVIYTSQPHTPSPVNPTPTKPYKMMSTTAFQTMSPISNGSESNSEHSQHTKTCTECGEHARSNSAIKCWSCLHEYPKLKKPIKTSDGRGRICKRCCKCGEPAKSNRAASCVHGCIDPFPKKAAGAKKANGAKKKRKQTAVKATKKAKKRKLQRNISDDLFNLLDEPNDGSAAALAIFGPPNDSSKHSQPSEAPKLTAGPSLEKIPSLTSGPSLTPIVEEPKTPFSLDDFDMPRQTSLDLVKADLAFDNAEDAISELFEEFSGDYAHTDTMFDFECDV